MFDPNTSTSNEDGNGLSVKRADESRGDAGFPPAVIVHGMPHVRLALATGLAFRLLSAPGASGTLGVGWWRALAGAAGRDDDILDCGEDGGAALLALRAGQRTLVLRGPFLAAVTDTAGTFGARVLTERPPALDLAGRGAARRLTDWLAGGTTPP